MEISLYSYGGCPRIKWMVNIPGSVSTLGSGARKKVGQIACPTLCIFATLKILLAYPSSSP